MGAFTLNLKFPDLPKRAVVMATGVPLKHKIASAPTLTGR
jgi:hypothetical protein